LGDAFRVTGPFSDIPDKSLQLPDMIRIYFPGVDMIFFTEGSGQSHGHSHLAGGVHHPRTAQPHMRTAETPAGHEQVPDIF